MAKDRDDKSGYSQRITANKLQQSYQVKPGETMTSIAASAGISPEELARVNRGATPLDVGQTIRVPGGGRGLLGPLPPPPDGGFRPGLLPTAGKAAIGGLTAMSKDILGAANAYLARPLGGVLGNAARMVGGAANYYGGQAGRYLIGSTPGTYSGQTGGSGQKGQRATGPGAVQYGATSAPDYSQLGALMQRITKGAATTGDIDAYINNARLNGYVEESVAPALAPIINARVAKYTGGEPLYDPSGAINPAAVGAGSGSSSGGGGGVSKTPTVIPGQPTPEGIPQEAYISPYVQGQDWKVVTQYDAERGVWVRMTLPTYGGKGRGGRGGGVGRYRDSESFAYNTSQPLSSYGLLNMSFRASTG